MVRKLSDFFTSDVEPDVKYFQAIAFIGHVFDRWFSTVVRHMYSTSFGLQLFLIVESTAGNNVQFRQIGSFTEIASFVNELTIVIVMIQYIVKRR